MLFEQPFIRVPYENYRRVFKMSQKNIEKDMVAVQNLAVELSSQDLEQEAAIKSVDTMIAKIEGLKQKLNDLHQTSGSPTQKVIRERLNHLDIAENANSADSPVFSEWCDTRLNRWLVDWALRNDKQATARSIAKSKGIEDLVDIELFTDIRRIESALQSHSCSEALAWCNENKTQLRKIKSTLEFDLRLQEFIELARTRQTVAAIAYMKKHLGPWNESHSQHIKQACALLAFPPSTSCGPYKRLYDLSRWATLTQSFRLAVYTLNTLPTEPLLHLSLYAGLASLKLPSCFDPATRNVDCPVCDGSGDMGLGVGLNRLADEVPLSHHVNSTIVCRLSGKIMDEDNGPYAFPNGYVYSREALEDMSANNDGIVTCPRTGCMCKFEDLKKVYIS